MILEEVQRKAHTIIMDFPISKNGQPYLVMKNGRKLFFNRFTKKYGLAGQETKYKSSDISRRLRLTEFFKFFLQECELSPAREEGRLLLESSFHRMVILNVKQGNSSKLELLSFYHL